MQHPLFLLAETSRGSLKWPANWRSHQGISPRFAASDSGALRVVRLARGSFSEDGQTLDAGIAAKAHYLDMIELSLGIFAIGCCSRKLLDAGSAHGGRLHFALARTSKVVLSHQME